MIFSVQICILLALLLLTEGRLQRSPVWGAGSEFIAVPNLAISARHFSLPPGTFHCLKYCIRNQFTLPALGNEIPQLFPWGRDVVLNAFGIKEPRPHDTAELLAKKVSKYTKKPIISARTAWKRRHRS